MGASGNSKEDELYKDHKLISLDLANKVNKTICKIVIKERTEIFMELVFL